MKVSATLVDRYRNRKCYCKRSIISPYPTHPVLTYVNATFSEWEGRSLTYYYQVCRDMLAAVFRLGFVVRKVGIRGVLAPCLLSLSPRH